MELEEINRILREDSPSPPELSELQIKLAGEYGFLAGRLEEILKVKPSMWLEIRKKTKSDASADKQWESSPEGLEESIYKLKMKGIEKQLSAINSRLHIASMEARNQF